MREYITCIGAEGGSEHACRAGKGVIAAAAACEAQGDGFGLAFRTEPGDAKRLDCSHVSLS